MPRSFLVKKPQSTKKPKYRGLSPQPQDPRITSEESLWHCGFPPHHHCPAPSMLPLRAPQPPSFFSFPHSSPNVSPLSFLGPCAEAYTKSHKPVQSCTEVNLKIQCVSEDARRSETLCPSSVPLLALFPTIAPGGSGSSWNQFRCLDCRKENGSFSDLVKHKQLQREWASKKYFSCKYCEKEYGSLGALKMHIRTHTLPCVCKLCGKAFSRPWLLQGHIRTHTGEKPFSCLHCSRAFADRSNLRAHLQTHSEVKKYQCAGCFKSFSRISLLAKHQEAGCPLS